MRPCDQQAATRLEEALIDFDTKVCPLPGLRMSGNRHAFVEQLLESIRRIRYIAVIQARPISAACAAPENDCFDPLKAAILHERSGNTDESFWLVFLFVHFGKHLHGGWRYVRDLYGKFGEGGRWDWASTSTNIVGFRAWLHTHEGYFKRNGLPGGFGNHRKYESLGALSDNGTGAVVESYVQWVSPPRSHEVLFADALAEAEDDPHRAFDLLYQSMNALRRFGRTARFDYLTMIGKLGLAEIEPGTAYISESTGPRKGAQLLFGSQSRTALETLTTQLGNRLGVGMQVMEDALCNWQKSPGIFRPFRG